VKLPFQKQGTIDDRNAETIDILPTIADALGIKPGWKWDGESLLRPSVRKTRQTFSWMNRNGTPLEFSSFSYANSKTLKLKLTLFGSEVNPDELFKFGASPELLGMPVEKIRMHKTDQIKAELYNRKRLQNVDLAQRFVPAMVSGKLHFQDGVPNKSTVVLAMNGIVRASAPSFPIGKEMAGFAMLLPESSFRQGSNEVSVILVQDDRYTLVDTGWVD
jgi:hypothetical protein